MPRSLSIASFGLALLLPIAAMAGSEPSYDMLVPYFEVELLEGESGRTTLLAVANHSPAAIEVRLSVYSNWGVEVLGVSHALPANGVHTANLRDWLLYGRLPGGRVLDSEELAHLQAALSGRPSPRDQRWYSTEVEPGLAVGYVTFEVIAPGGHRPLWGDYYIVDAQEPLDQGETLVNLDPLVDEDLPCKNHVIRFLEMGPSAVTTELMIWTPAGGQPSASPELAERWRVPARIEVFDEAGRRVKRLDLRLLPVERLPLCDVCWEVPFGWMEIHTPLDTFVTAHVSTAERDSLALHSYCVVSERGIVEGPGIDVEKLVNGEDADTPPGPGVPLGEAVTWSYVVSNIGTEPLSAIRVSDDRGAVPLCPQESLAPGESMTCSGSGAALACEQGNVATVEALAEDGTWVGDADAAYYTGQHHAALQIEKRTNGEDADAPPGPTIEVGQPVAWSYLVSNAGDVALVGVGVVDDRGVAVSCPKATLAPGESMTCNGGGSAVAGQYANVGTVTGEPPCGPAVSAADPSHYLGWQPFPAIALEKSTNDQDADVPPGPTIAAGQPVSWRYVVSNTGDVPLSAVAVSDDREAAVACPKTALAPGESMTCTASGVAQVCQYGNLGTAVGTPPEGSGGPVSAQDPSHYYGQHRAAISLVKTVGAADANQPPGPDLVVGDPLVWSFLVTNTGDVALTNVSVSDQPLDDIGDVVLRCPGDALAPAESMTCTAEGKVAAGQQGDVGTARGDPPCGEAVTAADPAYYYGRTPAIAIEKLTNGVDADMPPGLETRVGDSVLWTYVVTNIGDASLVEVAVTDDRGVVVTCPKTALAAGESMTCTASGTAAGGQYANVGTASGRSEGGAEVSASDPSHYRAIQPLITLEKRIDGQDADDPPGPALVVGAGIAWTYVVANLGDVRLTGVAVSDDQGPAVSCPQNLLEAGESMTCTAASVATAGEHRNVATATGTPPVGPAVTATDPAHYVGRTAALDVEKLVNGQDADAAPGLSLAVGSAVLWSYVTTNTGGVALANVTVTDNRGVAVSCPHTTLAPGESMTCTAGGTAAAGQYSNLATATGTPAGGATVNDQDPAYYFGQVVGNQGCTPGYWKNHTASWPPTGYTTSRTVQSVFSEAWRYPAQGFATLHDALAFAGGPGTDGAAEILLRAAVAALLNASHPDVAYPRIASQVLSDVNAALASGSRDTMLALAAALDADNNRGCPLH
jgi:hypothetical protein